jgi:hypothetical protein
MGLELAKGTIEARRSRCLAFSQATPLFSHHRHPRTVAQFSGPVWCCTTPGFRTKEEDDGPKRSFLSVPPPTDVPLTPNQRVLAQVRRTMEELGVSEVEKKKPVVNAKPVDLSHVNPLSALVGSFGAAAIAYAAWHVLMGTANFYATHPFETEFYVVRRINGIVRTALVGMFALGSGISGVTALGLFLLAGRTAIGKVAGEFKREGLGDSGKDSG